MTTPLKNCPCCGSGDVSDLGFAVLTLDGEDKGARAFFTGCFQCGCRVSAVDETEELSREEAHKRWNRRDIEFVSLMEEHMRRQPYSCVCTDCGSKVDLEIKIDSDMDMLVKVPVCGCVKQETA